MGQARRSDGVIRFYCSLGPVQGKQRTWLLGIAFLGVRLSGENGDFFCYHDSQRKLRVIVDTLTLGATALSTEYSDHFVYITAQEQNANQMV